MVSIIVLGIGYGFAAAVQPGPFQTSADIAIAAPGLAAHAASVVGSSAQRRSDHSPRDCGA